MVENTNPGRDERGRRTFLKRATAAGAVGAASVSGCLGITGGGGGTQSMKVGYATSLSGPFAVFGQSALDGAKLAKADLEDELGIDIEIVTADTKITPSTGLQRMKRLVTEEGVDFAMGGVSSAVALKMGTWASDNNVAYFATGAHSNKITGAKCAKYMFRPTCSNSMLAQTVGQEMVEAADRWYILYSNYTWGQTAQAAVSRILKNQGKTVVGKSATPFPADNYAPYLNKAKNSDATGIALLIAGLDLRKALSQLINKGMHETHTLAMHQLEDVVLWGMSKDAADELNIAGQVWGPAVDAGKQFKRRVKQESKTDPFVRHLLGYMSMDQAVRAAHRAGSTKAEDMRKAIEGHEVTSKIKDIKGGGEMYWRECDHQLVQPAYGVKALPTEQMTSDPWKTWFETTKQYAGRGLARACEETGCSF